MGHFCKICLITKSNESFSGKGRRNHICKNCACLPVEKRQDMFDENFIHNVLFCQSNISKNNIKQLSKIAEQNKGKLSEKAQAVAEVAMAHPGKKKRLGYLRSKHRTLFDKLVNLGILEDMTTPKFQEELEYEQWEFDNADDFVN